MLRSVLYVPAIAALLLASIEWGGVIVPAIPDRADSGATGAPPGLRPASCLTRTHARADTVSMAAGRQLRSLRHSDACPCSHYILSIAPCNPLDSDAGPRQQLHMADRTGQSMLLAVRSPINIRHSPTEGRDILPGLSSGRAGSATGQCMDSHDILSIASCEPLDADTRPSDGQCVHCSMASA